MAQKINPDSLHLGGDSPEYYVEYVPIPKIDQPESCALPPVTESPLTPAPLLQLNEACAFTFPDVLALPPVYNPPQVKFTACETLTATTQITTCPATKSSTLALIATGPTPSEDKDGAASCSLTLAGNLCVEACEDFTATTSVNFPKAMQGSRMLLTSKSIPNCGVDLAADLVLNACEDFKVTNSIIYKKAAKASHLDFEAIHRPDCGLDISGVIVVDACETFDARVNVNITGPGKVVQKNSWRYTKASIPDCGFTLDGDVVIKACEDFSADGQINFTGPPGVVRVITPIRAVAKKAPDCGLTLEGNIDITACQDFKVNGALNITGKPVRGAITITPTSQPDCGISFGGALEIKACDEVAAGGTVTVTSSRGGGTGSLSLSQSNDGCGIQLDGNIDITACSEVFAGGSVLVRTQTGAASGAIYLQANGDCGVNIAGDILVNACTNIAVRTDRESTLYTNFLDGEGKGIGSMSLQSNIRAELNEDRCGVVLYHEITGSENVTLDVKTQLYVEEASLSVSDGCCYTSEDAPHLKYNAEGNYLQLLGNMYSPSFSCDSCGSSPFAFSSIELESLSVGNISASSCCSGSSTLDLCGGSLFLTGSGANTGASPGNVYTTQYGYTSSMSSSSMTVTGNGQQMGLYSSSVAGYASGATISLTPYEMKISSGGVKTQINHGYIQTVGTGGTVNIFSTGGRTIGPVEIQVCVNGDTKTMLVLGSAPY